MVLHRRDGGQEQIMASKDKGGKSVKTAAAKTPKEKRQAKRDKKEAKEQTNRVL